MNAENGDDFIENMACNMQELLVYAGKKTQNEEREQWWWLGMSYDYLGKRL